MARPGNCRYRHSGLFHLAQGRRAHAGRGIDFRSGSRSERRILEVRRTGSFINRSALMVCVVKTPSEVHQMASNLFATKPLSLLLEEMQGENSLRLILGPVQLTALGVGSIIGTGIFILTGVAAHDRTGPALMLSFVMAGLACVFAALCYAEFASMVPVAGSAYTYAYATLGELFAWIIGWDLILEYAVGSATVAHGWSAHFQEFIPLFGLQKYLPFVLSKGPFDYCVTVGKDCPHTGFIATGAYFDLPAVLITFILTVVLVKGIKESATFNAVMVAIKLVIVLMVIGIGVFYINPA